MRMHRVMLFAVVGSVSGGCLGVAPDGVRNYDLARYPEALERLRSEERSASTWKVRDRAQYALYRGLTHMALSDNRNAVLWLGRARRAWDEDPTVFSDDERSRLAAALAHLPP
jgi:hypothetical protein